ncbi:DNA-directed DNA polymerase eta rad30 [Borealophlyctis nickersoniae]|nr:DNA-directed DNA polymerase eta rad30 [Borealophlyctis nickersoniae]
MQIFQRFCPKFQRASIDEAFLDMTQMVNQRLAMYCTDDKEDPLSEEEGPLVRWGEESGILVGDQVEESRGWRDLQLRIGADISKEIRATVFKELGYTCSTGICHNKTLAKLCSALNKPDKQTILRESQVLKFMESLPMSKIRNLGGKLGEQVEAELGIENAGELWKYPLDVLKSKFGDGVGVWLHDICRGICHDEVTERNMTKSMAACKSLRPSITKDEEARHWLGILSAELFTRLQDDYELNQRWPKTLSQTDEAGDKVPAIESERELDPQSLDHVISPAQQRLPRSNISSYFSSASQQEEQMGVQFTICDRCNQRVRTDEAALAEHEDYHFALTIQREERGGTASNSIAPPKKSGKDAKKAVAGKRKGGLSEKEGDKRVDYTSALERAKAIAARLTADAKAQGKADEPAANAAGVKRSHSEVDEVVSPSAPSREDHVADSSGRDYKRAALDDYDQQQGYRSGDYAYGGGEVAKARPGLGSATAASHYGPPTGSGANRVVEVTIPDNMVGLVIGRGGESMKKIEKTCNVRVQFAPAVSGEDDRIATISGADEDIQRAQELIWGLISQGPRGVVASLPGPGTQVLQMSVPSSKGTQNAVEAARMLIEELVASYPATKMAPSSSSTAYPPALPITDTIQVHTERVGLIIGRGGEVVKNIQAQCGVKINIEPSANAEGNRNVTITGPPEGVERAKDAVYDRVFQRGPGGWADRNPPAWQAKTGYQAADQNWNYGDQSGAWAGAAQGGYEYGATGVPGGEAQGYDAQAYSGQQSYDAQAYAQAWEAYYQQYAAQGYAPEASAPGVPKAPGTS